MNHEIKPNERDSAADHYRIIRRRIDADGADAITPRRRAWEVPAIVAVMIVWAALVWAAKG